MAYGFARCWLLRLILQTDSRIERNMTVETFSIECTTCRASLRVRDAAAVGQILTCPKCGSMVLVEAPVATEPELPHVLPELPSPGAMHSEESADSVVAADPPPQEAKAAGSSTDSVYRVAGRRSRPMFLADTVEDLTTYGSRGVDGEPILSSSPANSEGVREAAQDESLVASGRFRSWTLLTGAATAGVVMAIVFVNSLTPDGAATPDTPSVSEAEEEPVDATEGSSLELGIELAPGATAPSRRASDPITGGPARSNGASPSRGELKSTVPVASEPVSQSESPTPSTPLQSAKKTANVSAATAADPISEATPTPNALTSTGVNPPQTSSRIGSPAGVAGEVPVGTPSVGALPSGAQAQADLLVKAENPARSSSPESALPTTPLPNDNEPDTQIAPTNPPAPQPAPTKPTPEQLKATEEIPDPVPTVQADASLDPESPPGMKPATTVGGSELESALRMARDLARLTGADEPSESEEESTGTPMAETERTEVESDTDLVPTERAGLTEEAPAVPAREVDVTVRLQDRFESVAFQGKLTSFIEFLADFSTIPISLDADALYWSRLGPTTTISVPEIQASVEETLTAGLRPHGLIHARLGRHVWVSRSSDPTMLRAVSYRVEDLAPTPDEQVALSELVMQLVAPRSWSPAGGEAQLVVEPGALRVQQFDAQHFQLMRLCELLRVARGMPVRSSYPASYFRLGSIAEMATEKLNTSVTLTFLQPTRLAEVVQYLNEVSGTAILVDWVALEPVGISRDSEVTLSCVNKPLGDVLSDLLRPLDLTYRVVGPELLQITSQQQERTRLELAVYRLDDHFPEPADQAIFLGQLQTALGTEWFHLETGPCHLALDTPSRCLIAALPQSLHPRLVENLERLTR